MLLLGLYKIKSLILILGAKKPETSRFHHLSLFSIALFCSSSVTVSCLAGKVFLEDIKPNKLEKYLITDVKISL